MTLSVGFSVVDRELNAGDFVNARQKYDGEKIINLRRENGSNNGDGDVLTKLEVAGTSYIRQLS